MKFERRQLPLFIAGFIALTLVSLVFSLTLLDDTESNGVETIEALFAQTPVAYTTPLPDAITTPLDGTYAKIDDSQPQWWLCRRCADYRPAGGIWKLQFDKGVMRIYYDVTGWKSLASYVVEEDRLTIFNDPYCHNEVGEYTWRIEAGRLKLNTVQDTCSFDLRAQNLSTQTWSDCATTPAEPSGCAEQVAIPAAPTPADLPVTVHVFAGDSRFFAHPPELYAPANSEDTAPPAGVTVTYHQESIPYGLNRVVWWHGDWIEATTELPFTAMGVQFFGGPSIGWARVLLDGVEVWRGNTATLGDDGLGHYGGYVNISGLTHGKHTIRVESLGFDYHPVTVSSFGFSRQTAVAP